MLPIRSLRIPAALCVFAAALSGAEGNVVIDQQTLSAIAGQGAVAALELTVRNTGDGPLRMRLRDTGSGTGGTPATKGTLATYTIDDWFQKASCRFIAFDGLNLLQLNPGMRVTRLEDGALLRTVIPQSVGALYGKRLTWDGTSIWFQSYLADLNNPSNDQLARIIGQRSTLIANAGAVVRTVTLPPAAQIGQASSLNTAYDPLGNRVWLMDRYLGGFIDAATGTFTRQTHLDGIDSWTGVTWYDGSLWFTQYQINVALSDKTTVTRRSCSTGATTGLTGLYSAADVNYAVHGIAADGWGRFIVLVEPNQLYPKVLHVDSGIRGWMTSPDAGLQAATIPAGGQTVFRVRCDAHVAGVGSHASMLLVDSDDPQTPRVKIPVQFTVENRPADAPVGRVDSYATTWDAILTTPVPGVLGNDDGVSPVTAQVVTSTTHGVLTLNSNGAFTYDATDGFVGNDTFTYRAVDGLGRQSAATTVTIAVDHAPIPEIQVSPTTVSANAAPGSTATVNLTIANIGYGTLVARLSDGNGTGGTVGTITREASVATTAFTGQAVSLAPAGDACWLLNSNHTNAAMALQISLVDLSSGQILRSVVPNLPNDPGQSIAWDGTRLWVAEQVPFVTLPNGFLQLARDPRVFAVNPSTGNVLATVTLPKPAAGFSWSPLLTIDDQGALWLVNPGLTTWRIHPTTLAITTKPKISADLRGIAWYGGSLWGKVGVAGNISRFNPETGSLIAGQTFAWFQTGEKLDYGGLISVGFGRFVLAGGKVNTPALVQVDSGLRGWLQATPTTVGVGRQSSTTVRLDLVADLAGLGTRTLNLHIFSNDVTDPVVTVPITCTVAAGNQGPTITAPAVAGPALVLP